MGKGGKWEKVGDGKRVRVNGGEKGRVMGGEKGRRLGVGGKKEMLRVRKGGKG